LEAQVSAKAQIGLAVIMRILCLGEILWDVIDHAEHLGGAPLNFAAHAQKLGHEVYPLSAVGDDERGRRALELISARGISARFVRVLAGKATGTAEVELDFDGKPTFRIVRPAAYDFVTLSTADLHTITELQPQWVYFGTLYHMSPQAMTSTLNLLSALPKTRRFYDANLREGNWHLAVVEKLASETSVMKLNDGEAECLDGMLGAEDEEGSIENFCRRWQQRFRCDVMCVTGGERGCAILRSGQFVQTPGFRVNVADTVGAGDAFSAALLHGLSEGWDTPKIGRFANACGAVVASKPGAIPDWSVDEARVMLKQWQ
jgi:fructokinase